MRTRTRFEAGRFRELDPARALCIGLAVLALSLLLTVPTSWSGGIPSAFETHTASSPQMSADGSPASPPASGNWTKLNLTVMPPARGGESMVYDGKDGYLMLFGGYGGQRGYLNDTWKFSGGTWKRIPTSVAPPARSNACMVYDARDGYVVLFGGVTGYGYRGPPMNDTWKYAGGVWTNITPAASPPARYWAGMTYDGADREVVLFGGFNGTWFNGALNDTWLFSGGRWALLPVALGPPASGGLNLVFDARDGYVVMFGGTNSSETWKFHAGAWTNISHGTQPSPRWYAGMAYDSKFSCVLLEGGLASGGTWEFSRGSWSKIPAANSPRTIYQMADPGSLAFDKADGYGVFFGGIGPFNYVSGSFPVTHATWVYR
jgi:hypothetical protein